jgi:hypothetical protein
MTPKRLKKIFTKRHVTHWLTPPPPLPPYVTFGDIITYLPSPLTCHVLFEWPLSQMKTLSAIPLSSIHIIIN